MIGRIAMLVACYLMLGLAIGAWLVDRVGLAALCNSWHDHEEEER